MFKLYKGLSAKPWLKMLYVIFVGVLWFYSFFIGVRYTQQYPNDLRNRVVGARLQHDGISPYFYHWKQGDDFKYYDATNFYSLRIANISASPFYHSLLYPLAGYSQYNIAFFFLFLNYFLLAIIGLLFSSLARGNICKRLVPIIIVLFTFTVSWRSQTALGQLYFQVAFLVGVSIFGLMRESKFWDGLAGLLLTMAVLIKPTLAIMLVLAIVQLRSRIVFLVSIISGLIAYVIWVLTHPFILQVWLDFFEAIKIHSQWHLNPIPTGGSAPFEYIDQLEGFTKDGVALANEKYVPEIYVESSNLHYWIKRFGWLSPSPLFFSWLIFAMTLVFAIIGILKRNQLEVVQVLILALIPALLADYLSPILRGGYIGVLWLIPILVITAFGNKSLIAIGFISTGMLLELLPTYKIPMQHTIAEILFCIAAIWFVFSGNNFRAVKYSAHP